MQDRSITSLGETEMEILRHVWDEEEATIRQVHTRILEDRKVAYTTVMTIMKNLTEKGYLDRRKEGRSHVYFAAQPKGEVRQNILQGLIHKVFGGSSLSLVQTLFRSENLSAKERQDIQELLVKLQEKESGDDA